MLDISFVKKEHFPFCDIEITSNDIKRDNTILSALEIMLRTDGRVTLEEYADIISASYPPKLRGWWGDSFRDTPIGSKLWLMRRRKATNIVKMQCEQYLNECLQPLLDSNVASNIVVYTEWVNRGILAVSIKIYPKQGSEIEYKYNMIWEEVLEYVR